MSTPSLCNGEHPGREARVGPYTADQCRLCWRQLNDHRNGSNGPVRARRNCQHLGAETGELLKCGTCPGSVKLKVYNCDRHSRAVLGHDAPGAHGCLDCPDYAPPGFVEEAATVRHLLFHMWPVKRNERWKWHLEQLRQRLSLFNGRRILAVVMDEWTENMDAVKRLAAPLFDEIFEMPNDPSLREVATFEPLFSRVQSLDPGEAILWAHSKGVGRRGHQQVNRWAELQWETYCDYPEYLRSVLQQYPLAGSFKKIGHGWVNGESESDWHYSGSWFWVRSRDLFSLPDWKRIDRFYSGIEPYPSLHFRADEAGVLFHEGPLHELNLYQLGTWFERIEPAYARWKEERTEEQLSRSAPPLPPPGLRVEIGGGLKPLTGWLNVDRCPTADYQVDFETQRLPFDGESVAEVYSSHCFEHVHNLRGLLQEIARVCMVGARVEIRVPHWLSPMALCHGHVQVIPPEQVDHWCRSAIPYWWTGSSRRFRHVRTEQVPSGDFAEAKRLHPHWTDEQIMRYVPGAAHECRFHFEVIDNG